jgi:antitoxin ParD1/3/4
MTELTIRLPDSLREFVDTQVAEGGYETAGEYIQALLREAQRREAQEVLEAKLLEGLNSGPVIEVTPEYWEKKRAELLERHRKANQG